MIDKRKFSKKNSPERSDLSKKSAEIQELNVSKFVVNSASEAAHHTISQTNIIQLSPEDQVKFAISLIYPPKPNDALKRAFSLRKKIIVNA